MVDSQQKVSTSSSDVGAQPVRYVIGLDFLERRTESCSSSDTLRLTFYLQMPDTNNPNSKLWKVRFRCNLHDTAEDIKLFEGHGLTEINEEVERAIKAAVAAMLHALQVDENSIPLNHDYVFYPQLSPELEKFSGYTTLPLIVPARTCEEVRQPTSKSAAVANPTAPFVRKDFNHVNPGPPRTDECAFVTLEAPFRMHSLLAQINSHLRRARPFLVLPENTQHPVVDLPMLSSSRSSTKVGDDVTLSINIHEGIVNILNSTHISSKDSTAEADVIASQPKVQQQSLIYRNLSCDAVPSNNTGHSTQASAAVTPQIGSRSSQFQPQQMPVEVSSPIYDQLPASMLAARIFEMQNLQNLQQQHPHSEIPSSMSVCDQLVRQCMATLLSADPSLFHATLAALSTNYLAASQPMPTGLLNPQDPSLCSDATSTSSNPLLSSSAAFVNTDAIKQNFSAFATERAHQQQRMPPACGTTNPPMSTVLTATTNPPLHPRLVSSTNANAQSVMYEQIIWPNMPAKLMVLAPPTCISQGQPSASPTSAAVAATSPLVRTVKPPMTTAVSARMETLTASVSLIRTPREGVVAASSTVPPPPPPSSSTSTEEINEDQVVFLGSNAAQPNSMAATHLPTPPLPPPRKASAQPVPSQTAPSDPGVYKKIPPKFTVSSVESDATLCSDGVPPPSAASDGTSTLVAPNVTDSASNITPNTTLRFSPSSENDLLSACPPPPPTPTMSNKGSDAEMVLPCTACSATLP